MKRIMRYSLIMLIVLCLLVGGIIAYLSSHAGRQFLAAKISELASSEGQVITISNLQGSLWGDLTIGQVTVADTQGVWFSVSDTRVVYDILKFLDKQPPIMQVDVRNIGVVRLPHTTATEGTSTPTEIPSLREMAVYLPQQIAIHDITIAPAIAGTAQRLAVQGQGGVEGYNLQVNTLEGVETKLDAVITPNERDFMLKLVLDEMPGGVLGGVLSLPSETELHAKADITTDIDGKMEIHTFYAKAGETSLEAIGQYDVKSSVVTGNASAHVPDMAIIQSWLQQPVQGDVDVAVDVTGSLNAMQMEVTVESGALTFDTHHLEKTTLRTKGMVNLVALTGNTTLAGKTIYNGKPVTLETPVELTKDTLTLSDLNAAYDAFSAKARIVAQGTPSVFDLTTDATLTTPYGESQVALKGAVDTVAQGYQGEVAGQFAYRKERFTLTTQLDATAEQATIEALSLQGPGVNIKGQAEVNIVELVADGVLHVQAKDLAPLGRLLQQPLRGSAQGEVTLSSSQGKQKAQVQAVVKQLQAFGFQAAQAEIRAQAEDVKTIDAVSATLKGQGIMMDAIRIERINATAKGSLQKNVAVTVEGQGVYQEANPWGVVLAADAARPQDNTFRIAFRTLKAQYAGLPIQLQAPATFVMTSTQYSITPLTLEVAGGSVQAEGKITETQAQGEVHIRDIAFAQLPLPSPLPEGTINATLTLKGTAKAPILAWDAKGNMQSSGQEVALTAIGGWQQGTLQTKAHAQVETAQTDAELSLKAPLALIPFTLGIDATTPIAGNIKTHVPLEIFNAFLRPTGNHVEGVVSGDAKISGVMGRPVVEGEFTLAEGKYDQSDTGMCLRNMEATLRGTKDHVELVNFQAIDSEQKKLTASGRMLLEDIPRFSGEGKFDHFRLFCGGLASGEIDGGVSLSGTAQAMNIAGKLILGPLNIQIPGAQASANIPSVETEWVKPTRNNKPEEEEKPGVIGLDVSIQAPNQLFVRGRGLEAEFEGDVHITGTAMKPLINGQFSSRRGSFTLLDRELNVDRAVFKFQGAIPPSPYVDVKAVSKVKNTTVTVTIGGRALKPSFTLASNPSLPQDEALALLLFGRQLSTISPFEAIKLAQATRVLAGKASEGPDLLGSVRETLGLDELDVGLGESNNVTVSTGKYITDKVYVGVSQGATPEDREIVTEVDISPSVSGKTTVDGKGNQGFGVEWKKDY